MEKNQSPLLFVVFFVPLVSSLLSAACLLLICWNLSIQVQDSLLK